MRSATFLLNKHPYAQQAGDTRLTRLLIELVSESVPVRGLALWSGPSRPAPIELRTVRKPPVRLARLAAQSLAKRHSIVHTRYLTDELVRAVADDDADTLIAEHTYMAEAALAAGRAGPGLLVNTHVLESSALEARAAMSRSLAPLSLEAARTRRDEVRCATAAGATACLGEADLAVLRGAGVTNARRLDFALPPLEPTALDGPPLALFVGDRGWGPNAQAARALAGLWPRIAAQAPGAQLVVAGQPARRERPPRVPGVRWLGFVDDVDELYRSARVLVAPVAIGGGVRVKVLEAAARGLPVVATRAGLGSIGRYLPLEPVTGEELVERAALLLRDRDAAAAEGAALYEANAELWRSGFVQSGVEAWIAAGT